MNRASWAKPRAPTPTILPVRSSPGRILASSSSTTRDDFSSTTLLATAKP